MAYRRGLIGQRLEIIAERILDETDGYRVTGMSERFVSVQAAGTGPPPSTGSRMIVAVTNVNGKRLEASVLESPAVSVSC